MGVRLRVGPSACACMHVCECMCVCVCVYVSPQIPGEDLEPYRAASQSILNVLSRYGPACRLGLDEVFVDVTQVS